MKLSIFFVAATLLFGITEGKEDSNFKKYTLSAQGINITFIPYGARVTNLLVPDRTGRMRDIIVGPDNGQMLRGNDLSNHSYFGPIVGRYANRIKNGTFIIDGKRFKIPANENHGLDALHGGKIGYDVRNWTVVSFNKTAITFSYMDHGDEGFPGRVFTVATFAVEPHSWISRIVSFALDVPTPIMLSNHVYWSLDAYSRSNNSTILNDSLWMPYSDRYIAVDGIQVPTGGIGVVENTTLDFTKPKRLGKDIFHSRQCGSNCVGYDNAFIFNRRSSSSVRDIYDTPVVSWSSPSTGIRMDLFTNQAGIQLYTCNRQNNTIRTKRAQSHGKDLATIPRYGCLVLEPQDWIDGINNPQFGRDKFQLYSPTTGPAVYWTKYTFTASNDTDLLPFNRKYSGSMRS